MRLLIALMVCAVPFWAAIKPAAAQYGVTQSGVVVYCTTKEKIIEYARERLERNATIDEAFAKVNADKSECFKTAAKNEKETLVEYVRDFMVLDGTTLSLAAVRVESDPPNAVRWMFRCSLGQGRCRPHS